MEGGRDKGNIVEMCCREYINRNLYDRRLKGFLESAKKCLLGDTAREPTSDEVKDSHVGSAALRLVNSNQLYPIQ